MKYREGWDELDLDTEEYEERKEFEREESELFAKKSIAEQAKELLSLDNTQVSDLQDILDEAETNDYPDSFLLEQIKEILNLTDYDMTKLLDILGAHGFDRDHFYSTYAESKETKGKNLREAFNSNMGDCQKSYEELHPSVNRSKVSEENLSCISFMKSEDENSVSYSYGGEDVGFTGLQKAVDEANKFMKKGFKLLIDGHEFDDPSIFFDYGNTSMVLKKGNKDR